MEGVTTIERFNNISHDLAPSGIILFRSILHYVYEVQRYEYHYESNPFVAGMMYPNSLKPEIYMLIVALTNTEKLVLRCTSTSVRRGGFKTDGMLTRKLPTTMTGA